MPKRKLKIKFNAKAFTNYIGTILLSTLIFASILISLPLTERYLENLAYNLNTKNYWAKEYTLLLDTTENDEADSVRNIIYKRLNKYGVEEVSTYSKYTEDEKKIRVEVQTSKSQENVEELIRNPFQYQIVTRKEDVDFDDEENQYAYLIADNYETTEWDYKDFRNIHITELQNSTGEYSYFALFKPGFNKQKGFEDFLIAHEGEYIGVNIDGFVTPYYVQPGNESVFALQLSTEDPEQVKIMSLLYNSGNITSGYSLEEEKDLEVDIPEINYIWLSVGMAVAILITYIYLYVVDNSSNEIITKSLVSTVIFFAIYLTYLKLMKVPVDTFILAIEATTIVILNRVFTDNKDSVNIISGILVLFSTALTIFGTGYMRILGLDFLIITGGIYITIIFSELYINMVKKVLKK